MFTPSSPTELDVYRLPILRRLLLILAAIYLLYCLIDLHYERAQLALAELLMMFYCLFLRQLTFHSQRLLPYLLVLYGGFSALQIYSSISTTVAVTAHLAWSLLVPVFIYPLTGRRWGNGLTALHLLALVPMMAWAQFSDHINVHWLNLLSLTVLYLSVWAVAHQHESERFLLLKSLQRRADSDPLTGLQNRSQLQPQFKQLRDRAVKLQSKPLVLVLIDLDYFKQVNDRYGHPAGDATLLHFSELLRSNTRHDDQAFRLGGEEFALLLPHTDSNGAMTLLTKLQRFLAENPCQFKQHSISYAFSAGIACWPNDNHELHNLYSIADRRLYLAKASGRSRICQSDSAVEAEAEAEAEADS
ncbi:GGDEF domain-containing protein [Ferrimonas senticii]|uniref:GGDEF domain-containing protein n=1 Tax=Ferrimonas senticii TaxID=394566 RepID=UPI000416B48E|nr:GGDEF domain-containing protein [Ferrimonas senticii]